MGSDPTCASSQYSEQRLRNSECFDNCGSPSSRIADMANFGAPAVLAGGYVAPPPRLTQTRAVLTVYMRTYAHTHMQSYRIVGCLGGQSKSTLGVYEDFYDGDTK